MTAPFNQALIRCALAHRHLAATLLARLGLHPGQERLLMALWARDRQAAARLARQLGVTPPTVTNMLHKLEDAGFVVRVPDPDDQRVTLVALTDAGRDLRGAVEALQVELEERALAGFGDEERETFRALLVRAARNLAPQT